MTKEEFKSTVCDFSAVRPRYYSALGHNTLSLRRSDLCGWRKPIDRLPRARQLCTLVRQTTVVEVNSAGRPIRNSEYFPSVLRREVCWAGSSARCLCRVPLGEAISCSCFSC